MYLWTTGLFKHLSTLAEPDITLYLQWIFEISNFLLPRRYWIIFQILHVSRYLTSVSYFGGRCYFWLQKHFTLHPLSNYYINVLSLQFLSPPSSSLSHQQFTWSRCDIHTLTQTSHIFATLLIWGQLRICVETIFIC